MGVISKNGVQQFCEAAIANQEMTDKEKIDILLQLDCDQYTRLGTDSLAKDKNLVKSNSKLIYKTIAKINKSEGDLLLKSIDST